MMKKIAVFFLTAVMALSLQPVDQIKILRMKKKEIRRIPIRYQLRLIHR